MTPPCVGLSCGLNLLKNQASVILPLCPEEEFQPGSACSTTTPTAWKFLLKALKHIVVQLYLKRKSRFPITQFAVSGATKLYKETKLHLILLFSTLQEWLLLSLKRQWPFLTRFITFCFIIDIAAPPPRQPDGRGRVSDGPASDSQDKGGSSSKQPPHVTFTSRSSKTLWCCVKRT